MDGEDRHERELPGLGLRARERRRRTGSRPSAAGRPPSSPIASARRPGSAKPSSAKTARERACTKRQQHAEASRHDQEHEVDGGHRFTATTGSMGKRRRLTQLRRAQSRERFDWTSAASGGGFPPRRCPLRAPPRDPRPLEELRRPPGARRRVARARAGRDPRAARPERRRQDDAGPQRRRAASEPGRRHASGSWVFEPADDARAIRPGMGARRRSPSIPCSPRARTSGRFGRYQGLAGPAPPGRRSATSLDWIGLADRADEKTDKLSGGMKRRLNIAAGTIHEPARPAARRADRRRRPAVARAHLRHDRRAQGAAASRSSTPRTTWKRRSGSATASRSSTTARSSRAGTKDELVRRRSARARRSTIDAAAPIPAGAPGRSSSPARAPRWTARRCGCPSRIRPSRSGSILELFHADARRRPRPDAEERRRSSRSSCS